MKPAQALNLLVWKPATNASTGDLTVDKTQKVFNMFFNWSPGTNSVNLLMTSIHSYAAVQTLIFQLQISHSLFCAMGKETVPPKTQEGTGLLLMEATSRRISMLGLHKSWRRSAECWYTWQKYTQETDTELASNHFSGLTRYQLR